MSDVVNAIVAFAVIVFIFRWATSGSSNTPDGPSATAALGFRPKHVTQDMVDQIHSMFPDIPTDNIRYDLLRTGSVELTSNKILERGLLEPPPATYFTIYPRTEHPRPAAPTPNTNNANASTTTARQPTLIERYNLEHKVASLGEDVDEAAALADAGGKAKWEDTSEKREASLRKRKAQMILAARQRIMAQQQKEASGSSSGSLSSS